MRTVSRKLLADLAAEVVLTEGKEANQWNILLSVNAVSKEIF